MGPMGPRAHKTKKTLLRSYYVVIIILIMMIMMIQGQGQGPGAKGRTHKKRRPGPDPRRFFWVPALVPGPGSS